MMMDSRQHHQHHRDHHSMHDDNGTTIRTKDKDDATNQRNDDDQPLQDDATWPGYFRCDDLLPPVCDDRLTMTNGTVETLPGVLVSYWKYTPTNLPKNKAPVVVINGGPGLPHNFVVPTRNLACDGREVVLYDQAGTGASQIEVPENSDDEDITAYVQGVYPELLTLDYYATTELPALLQALDFDSYHIMAESWGTQIAFQFAVHAHQSHGLQSLLLNAPIADNPKFIQYQWDPISGTVGRMPKYLQQRLQYYNATQEFDNPEFVQLETSVISTFNARIGVQVDCWIDTEAAGISSIDYAALVGPSDLFTAPTTSDLHGWSVLSELHQLRQRQVPVQLNHGGFDLVRPQLIADTARAIGGQGVECHLLPQAAHSILLDSPKEVMSYLQSFLTRVEYAKAHHVPFVANGTCPNNNADDVYYNKYGYDTTNNNRPHMQQQPTTWRFANHNSSNNAGSMMELGLAVLLAMTISFALGHWVGTRRNKGFMGGYEPVPHHHAPPASSAAVVSRTNTIELE